MARKTTKTSKAKKPSKASKGETKVAKNVAIVKGWAVGPIQK